MPTPTSKPFAWIAGFLCCSYLPQANALDFHCMAFRGNYSGLHFQAGQDSDQPVEINEYGLSLKYSYNGPSPLVFFNRSVDQEGNVTRTPVAQLPFDPRYPKLLLIFYPNPSAQGTLNIYPIPSDDNSMPPGSFRVQNQTKLNVAMLLNGQTHQFASGQYQVVSPPPAERRTLEVEVVNETKSAGKEDDTPPETEKIEVAGSIPVQFAYQNEEKQWETFFKKKWLSRGDIRTFVFVYNIDGVLQLKNFVEIIGK
jgi:hypothetical protein